VWQVDFIPQLEEGNLLGWQESLIFLVEFKVTCSVASAQADVFARKLSKIGIILRIFDNLDEIKSRWVLCQS
jgi:hypothetical protein